jgi:predicted lipid-binding transport protein (Tim44 family)
MTSEVIQILFFALLAAAVLFQLYNVLGRRVGRQPEDVPAAAKPRPVGEQTPVQLPPPLDTSGTEALKALDPNFELDQFLEGARIAHERIVKAFSAGDRETLKPLLSPAVAQSFDTAIAAREAEGRTQETEFLHPARADLDKVETIDGVARARVRFLAELRIRSTGPEGQAIDDRRTAEMWSFERKVGATDPNWLLVRVEAAEA